ncbi:MULTISPECIES: hypothetical protein [Sphingobium]|uniref:Uncharacterized protein n=2 Tax=Sphingobium cupriresistens TaxID=1132417 RepID=A0A0J8AEC8_9SPHN|nr:MULTISPECIES: hypothetical protein [Sphingobium]KMS53370.1 hypothetical protein V473_19255 [Sphingobium cupriresistens LL01]MBJ7375638.1 hypothetical protein [Sphingobium sp.]RYM13792.1 hypothetical protein EWH12_03720 [Sphingobium cupriresistens]
MTQSNVRKLVRDRLAAGTASSGLANPDTVVDPGAIASMLAQIEGDDRIGILDSRPRRATVTRLGA